MPTARKPSDELSDESLAETVARVLAESRTTRTESLKIQDDAQRNRDEREAATDGLIRKLDSW